MKSTRINAIPATPYLVSDRMFRKIISDFTEALQKSRATSDTFMQVISTLIFYLTKGKLPEKVSDEIKFYIDLRRAGIDKAIARARAARKAAQTRRERRRYQTKPVKKPVTQPESKSVDQLESKPESQPRPQQQPGETSGLDLTPVKLTEPTLFPLSDFPVELQNNQEALFEYARKKYPGCIPVIV